MKSKFAVAAAVVAVLGVSSQASAQVVSGDCPEAAPAARSPFGDWFSGLRDLFQPRWCSQGSYGMSGWAVREGAPSNDSTSAFQDAHTKAKAGESPLPANASDYVYVFVGGLYTERYPGYMADNIGRLESRGLTTRRVNLDTDAPVETNASTVRDAILAAAAETGKKVVILGHSKGGVDTAAALALFPELREHVRVNIAMQAPYGGTPVAQDITGCPRLKRLTDDWVSNVWMGSPQSMRDLTYDSRRAFIAANPYPSDVPTLSLATSRTSFGTIVRATQTYMKTRYGLDSDGLVPREDAIIPGSNVILLDDMDHAEPTTTGVPGFREYHPGDVTEALIAVALGQR